MAANPIFMSDNNKLAAPCSLLLVISRAGREDFAAASAAGKVHGAACSGCISRNRARAGKIVEGTQNDVGTSRSCLTDKPIGRICMTEK